MFSRRTMFGPSSRRTSASKRIGTGPACGVSTGKSAMRSKSACGRLVELDDQIERRAAIENAADRRAREARLDRLATSSACRPYRAIADRFNTKRTNGMSICCSSERSTTPGTRLTASRTRSPSRRSVRQIIAEHLDGDIRPRARQHVVDPV